MNDNDYMSDWYFPMDFGHDILDETSSNEDNFNYD